MSGSHSVRLPRMLARALTRRLGPTSSKNSAGRGSPSNRGLTRRSGAPLTPEEEARRLEEEEAIRRATGGGDVVIRRERGGFKLPGT